MDHHQPYSASPSFPYSITPLPPNNSSIPQPFPAHQHTAPAQRIQHQQEREWHTDTTNTQSTFVSSAFPSAEQNAAVASIHGISIPTILVWLENLRSSHRGEPVSNDSLPPAQHFDALRTLINCPDVLVHTWLNAARSPRQYRFII